MENGTSVMEQDLKLVLQSCNGAAMFTRNLGFKNNYVNKPRNEPWRIALPINDNPACAKVNLQHLQL